jgi:hypothetical protein
MIIPSVTIATVALAFARTNNAAKPAAIEPARLA